MSNAVRSLALILLAPAGLSGPASAAQGAAPPPGRAAGQSQRFDQRTARQVVQAFSTCLFSERRPLANLVLAAPYSSDRQVAVIRDAMQGEQDCLGRSGLAMAVSAPTLAGALAEAGVHARFAAADFSRVSALTDAEVARDGLMPRNGYEDLALCVVRAGPAAVKDFISTEPGSTFEQVAFHAVVPLVAPCVPQGQNLSLDMAGLRSVVAVGLYRTLDAITPAERN